MPIIGVNTFRDPNVEKADSMDTGTCVELARATDEEKKAQLKCLADRVCSLGQISWALYDVGGRYRRNMWKPLLLKHKESTSKGGVDFLWYH